MQQAPLVSVIIPMRNEAGHIGRCLDSVLAQDYPAERTEILVVDGDSDDASPRVLSGYGVRIRVLRNPARIVPTAMNIGIRAAGGEIIARVDAHTVLSPDYIRVGVEVLRRTGADNVGGPMRSTGGGPWGDAIASAMASRFGIGAYFHFAVEDREVDTVYMGMYPRKVFERIGLFDEELVRNQDDELNYRLRKSGGRIFVATGMHSLYQNRQSLRTLGRQFFQYGWWKIRVLQKHPGQMSARHFVPPLFVACVLIGGVLTPISVTVRWLWAMAIGVYGGAVLIASVQIARRQRWGQLGRLMATFVTMHFSWGAGFLLGGLRFARRWFTTEPAPPALAAAQNFSAAAASE